MVVRHELWHNYGQQDCAKRSTEEVPVDSQKSSKPLKKDFKNNFEEQKETFPTFIPTPTVRNGFTRKKGENPFVCDLNLKINKEKKQSNFTTMIHGLELLVVEIQLLYM